MGVTSSNVILIFAFNAERSSPIAMTRSMSTVASAVAVLELEIEKALLCLKQENRELRNLSSGKKNDLLAGLAIAAEVADLKKEIITLAKSFEGQGDPDYSKQDALKVLVEKLLVASPQPPVKERLKLLYGPWKQVWGPYDYRGDERGVDPTIEPKEIYQVVFENGYYFNVGPDYKGGDKSQERIGLLRGEYKLDPENQNLLRVQFTRLTELKKRPTELPLFEIPALSEARKLADERVKLPGFLVRLFFGGGALREVYTDADLHILYGSNGSDFKKEFIYIMTKVN